MDNTGNSGTVGRMSRMSGAGRPRTVRAGEDAERWIAGEPSGESSADGGENVHNADGQPVAGFEPDEWGGERGRLFARGEKTRLRGRTLDLILWLAANQERINAARCESGQLWLTWKGYAGAAITGTIVVRL